MFEDVLNKRVQELLSKDVTESDLRIEISELITDYIAIQIGHDFRVSDFVALVQSITQQIAKTLSDDECYDFGEQLNKIYRRD
jgi:hexokinase